LKRTDFDAPKGSSCHEKGRRPVTNKRKTVAQSPALRIAALGITCVLAAAISDSMADQSPPVDSSSQSIPLQQQNVVLPDLNRAAGDFSADIEARKSYAIPAVEILVFDGLLNLINRHYINSEYESNVPSIWHNLHRHWVIDNDPFKTNQLGHPYQGSMYQGFARSAGLGYWESLGYTVVGSATWEIAGETTAPSFNDQITTGIGGSFLGESLFRMSSLVLEKSEMPKFWREVFATVVSPPTGINRLAFGDRFDSVFSSRNAEYYGRLALGASATLHNQSGPSTKLEDTVAIADFSLDYGMPGKPGYEYDLPFDYFEFKATVSSANGFENLMTRGLLVGEAYEAGKNYRGVWGLYGSYDYIEPQTFRVSSTALSLGTTAQAWLSQRIALQGSAALGAGYAAVGTVHGTTENDYHFGLAPQALLALRFIFGDRASFDATGREYFVSRIGSGNRDGHDNIIRADVAFTVRVWRQHAVAIRYLLSRRDTVSPQFGNITQSSGWIGLFYTFLGNDGFGAVDWRGTGPH